MKASTEKVSNRPGATAGTVGALLALQVILFGALGSATTASVSFAGRELNWTCAFQQQFGIPCPNCGMTRSVLLSLHGHFGEALALNPAGPILVLGVVLFSASMFFLMFCERTQAGAALENTRRRIRQGAIAYGALMLVVWMGHWLSEIL